MVEVDIPRSLFEEQGRQLYGGQLLQLQVSVISPSKSSVSVFICYFRNTFSSKHIIPNQVNEKLTEQQLAYLSSPKAVTEFLESNKENITHMIKQSLAVGDIFKRENLQVYKFQYLFPIHLHQMSDHLEILGFVVQYSTEELVREVNNSIAEFDKHKQDYDEESVKAQVRKKSILFSQ